MDWAVLAFMSGLGAALLWLIWFFIIRPAGVRKERSSPRYVKDGLGVEREKGMGLRSCPVCGERLAPGVTVKSKVYDAKADSRIMHIFGCPYCWPDNGEYRRVCPVCEKYVPRGGFLVARYFEQPNRRHVHVLGCSGCRFG